MYTLNITKAIKKMLVNEVKDFIFKIYYKRIGFLRKMVIIQKELTRSIVAWEQINRKNT